MNYGETKMKALSAKQKITDWIFENYDVIIIPKYFYIKLDNIFHGTLKNMSRPIPAADLLDMWKRKMNYLNEINNKNNNYQLVCSSIRGVFSFSVDDEYLYIFTNNYVRRINKDLSGCNYRLVYESDYQRIKSEHPELTDNEINKL